MKDLLLDQRVCKFWQALITSSIRLRRALFLEPVSCGDISYLDWRLDDKKFYDEIHADLGLGEHIRGPNLDQPPKTYPSHWGTTREDTGKYRVFVNPLLAPMFPFLRSDGVYWQEQLEDLPKSAQHPRASWQSMFFTQPPVNCMAIEWDSGGQDGQVDWTIISFRKAAGSKGINMGTYTDG